MIAARAPWWSASSQLLQCTCSSGGVHRTVSCSDRSTCASDGAFSSSCSDRNTCASGGAHRTIASCVLRSFRSWCPCCRASFSRGLLPVGNTFTNVTNVHDVLMFPGWAPESVRRRRRCLEDAFGWHMATSTEEGIRACSCAGASHRSMACPSAPAGEVRPAVGYANEAFLKAHGELPSL